VTPGAPIAVFHDDLNVNAAVISGGALHRVRLIGIETLHSRVQLKAEGVKRHTVHVPTWRKLVRTSAGILMRAWVSGRRRCGPGCRS
jgi:hypothetical protein